mgnify:CR=1 FL=1
MQPPPIHSTAAALRPRKTAESIDGKIVANNGSIPLTTSPFPIDRLFQGRNSIGENDRKFSIAQPSMKHVGQSIPLAKNIPRLIANESLTQQVTQLKQSRALITNQNRMKSLKQVNALSQQDRTIKKIDSPNETVGTNQGSIDSTSSKIARKTIDAQLGRDFTLPEGRSPQQR